MLAAAYRLRINNVQFHFCFLLLPVVAFCCFAFKVLKVKILRMRASAKRAGTARVGVLQKEGIGTIFF